MASSRRNDDTLCTDILRFLLTTTDEACEKRVADVYRARSKKCRKCNIHNANELADFLEEYPQVFEVFEDRGQDCVAPTTQLTLCPVHSQKSGSCRDRSCTGLHFCIFYLLSGQCAFASSNHSECLFSHNLEADPHNFRLLQQNFLVGLNLTELRRLFCLPGVRRGVTVPKICRYYNKHMGCNKGGKCRALHLCHPYVLETCKFGRGCRRNHDIDNQQVKQVLTFYGVRVKGRKLTHILMELRSFPGEEDREDAGSWSDDDDGEYYDDRGRSLTGQAPAYRRSMSQNRSASRAASRNRSGSSSVQMPPRTALRDNTETVHMTQNLLEQALLRTRQLETELARTRGVAESDLQQMPCLSPNDYKDHLDNGIFAERQRRGQNSASLAPGGPSSMSPARRSTVPEASRKARWEVGTTGSNRLYSGLRSDVEDSSDYISPRVQNRPDRNATEHAMADESGLRNGYSMPPAQPFLDSMTLAKSVRNGNASQGVTSRPGSLSSHDTAMAFLNGAPTLQPDSSFLAASNVSRFQSLQGYGEQRPTQAQTLPAQTRTKQQQPSEMLRSQQQEKLRLQREVERGRQAELQLQHLTLGQPNVMSEHLYLSLANASQGSASLDPSTLHTASSRGLGSRPLQQPYPWSQHNEFTSSGGGASLLGIGLDPVNVSVDSSG
ncbi:uncharacterized protein [Littorina saxatilis]|uniref:C3H1-type domain-containing protein n=1 Tax=Littorina saxatilis TaxID=31220 RepID=A0AAN9AU50_9CAEN